MVEHVLEFLLYKGVIYADFTFIRYAARLQL